MTKKQDLQKKLMANSIILEQVVKLNPEEKQKVILKLLEGKTERELGEEIGVPHSTIHDWKTLRQDNTGKNIHISLAAIYRKISDLEPKDIDDWGRLAQIKTAVDRLLRERI